ncbi:MAG: DUF6261 family protein [Prevotellaceae bacterium]|jgi:hypothetical protein|nr:DUF6261 family protein [Prevotellaceae bacterium]
MGKIRTIYFSYFRAISHYEYLKEFATLLNATAYADVKTAVTALLPEFTAAVAAEEALVNRMRKSDLTAPIAATDARVDRCLTGMLSAIISAQHHFTPAVAAAAESLHNRFLAFGNIREKDYEAESASVNLLIADLNSTEYSAKAALVGLAPWIAELTAAEGAFEALMRQRYAETALKPQGTVADARHRSEAAYRPIVERIDAAAVMSETPAVFETFITNLNAIIDYFNEHAPHRVRKNLSAAGRTVIEPIPTQHYTGEPITPAPVVYYREDDVAAAVVRLEMGRDFDVTYKNNDKVGMAQLTIHGKGAYKGKVLTTFSIENVV